jgi:hypothetical protein
MVYWIEAESFNELGGWSIDTQFIDQMGSAYIIATGVGKQVNDAITTIELKESGTYRLWVRTTDWFTSHSPGIFQVIINNKISPVTFGKSNDKKWKWIDGNQFELEKGLIEIRIHDLTGWWGRCDAIVLENNNDFEPSNDLLILNEQRSKYSLSKEVINKKCDVIIIGGGAAGCAAAIAAARNDANVALIQDRPILGGNASDEIKIPPIGYMGNPPDKLNITGITEELFPFLQGWKSYASSSHLEYLIKNESNITLFLNTTAIRVEMSSSENIKSISAFNNINQTQYQFEADIFIDCTGHGSIGYYAKADYKIGEEAEQQFNESLAPVNPSKTYYGK